jgi:hypothetical protein
MLDISPPANRHKSERARLARVRRQARKYGLRVLKDWTGGYNVIATHVEPPRALVGLEHVPLSDIEAAVSPPPRPLRPKRQQVERLNGGDPSPITQATHPGAAGLMQLVEAVMRSAS